MTDKRAELDSVIRRHRHSGDALIEVLHVAQQLYGYLSKSLLAEIAYKLQLPPSKVLGVATFYHLFRLEPPRPHTAVVCMGTACYSAGADGLVEKMQSKHGPDKWTIETGRCVGSCGLAPVVVCDGIAHSRVTKEQIERGLK